MRIALLARQAQRLARSGARASAHKRIAALARKRVTALARTRVAALASNWGRIAIQDDAAAEV
jgi:hypothetical protein